MEHRRRKAVCTLNATSIIVILFSLNFMCESVSVNTESVRPFLRRFEPVFYNTSDVLDQHRRVRRHNQLEEDKIKLQFYSHGRNFQLNLDVDKNLFHPNVIIENSEGPIKYDTQKVLTGTIKGDPASTAHGILTSEGVFDGYLSTQHGDEFYMEPKTAVETSQSIMYRAEDVDWPTNNDSACASHHLHINVKEDGSFRKNKTANELYLGTQTKRKRRKRWAIDPKKKTCMLYLQADHLFYERFGSEEASIDIMTKHIQRVNDIYKSTDFDNDGKPDDITFMIKRVKVHTVNHTKDPAYRYQGEFQVIKFLELFSEGDYDSFCLAYMFTFRDFEGGTLGLAWTGDLKNAGGVCEKKGHFRGGLKSLNTGIITLLNYGKVVPPSVSYVTLAHEIGHNFGSPHDPEVDKSCVPGGDDGNYIMFARATAGDKKNNNRFSPCSLRSILPVLNNKARDLHGCFTEPQASICGNGVVEKGEECDCGWEEDCKETCCFPMQLRPPQNEPPCRLKPKKSCSPSQGPCCTDNCTMKYGDKCREDNGCRDASFCDGLQPFCPVAISKPNKTVCNKESVCFMGECTGSICLAYGLESCQCNPNPWESSSKLCELCCKLPGEGHPCISSSQWNEPPYDVPDMFSKPGSPCKNYTGYCDAYQSCREIDPSGPLATLRKLLLADEGLAFIADWIDNHWYAVLIFVAVLISSMILTAKLCGKRAKARLRKLTVMHSNVEAIQIQRTYLEDAGHTVHPVAVRKKIPFKKKVRERRSKHRNRRNKERKVESSANSPAKADMAGNNLKKSRSGNKTSQKKIDDSKATKVIQPIPQSQTQQSHAGRSPMPLPTMTTSGNSTPPVENNVSSKIVASTSSPQPQVQSQQLQQITHEVNTAIVPHAKEQKRKLRKSRDAHAGHRKHNDRPTTSASKPAHQSRSSPEKKRKPVLNSVSQVPVGKKISSDPSKANSSAKKNIQVVYRAPFSVKVQVVATDGLKGGKKHEKENIGEASVVPTSASKKATNPPPISITSSNGTRSKPPSSTSFLQRRQRNHGKKSKNPSQSELRVLIPPHNEEDDMQSPITPMT